MPRPPKTATTSPLKRRQQQWCECLCCGGAAWKDESARDGYLCQEGCKDSIMVTWDDREYLFRDARGVIYETSVTCDSCRSNFMDEIAGCMDERIKAWNRGIRELKASEQELTAPF